MMNRRQFMRSIAGAAVALPAAAALPTMMMLESTAKGRASYTHLTYEMGFAVGNKMIDDAVLNIEAMREALAMFERMRDEATAIILSPTHYWP